MVPAATFTRSLRSTRSETPSLVSAHAVCAFPRPAYSERPKKKSLPLRSSIGALCLDADKRCRPIQDWQHSLTA